MNGPQDVGGMMGFGPVAPEANEPVFHQEWEKRALALTLAMGALRQWSIDTSRHARECLPHAVYWQASYYEIWIDGLEKLMAKTGLLDGPQKQLLPLQPNDVPAALAKGSPASRAVTAAPLFQPGQAVRARNLHACGHSRLPRYLEGCKGLVSGHHGGHVFPDSNAHGHGEAPCHLYSVRFQAEEVFGRETGDQICADLFEPYLEAL